MTPIRILVVEDEGIVATDIQRQLERLGYAVCGVASSGEEAVDIATAAQPNLVVMDIHLAGAMDGIAAATLLRQRYDIPSVFLTAYATDDVVERAKDAAPLGYLIKPFDEHSLRTTIEIALHKHQLNSRLRQSEARYRAVIQSAHDAVITADHHGAIVGWSPAAAQIFGYSEAEVLGQPIGLLMPPPFRALHGPALASADDRESTFSRVREVDAVRRDGSTFPAELTLARWATDEGHFVTAFLRDVTLRKQSEATLRLQAAALNAAANAIVITDRDGTIEWVNPAFTQATGYPAAEAIGKNPRDLVKSGVHPAALYEEMWHTLTAGRVWVGELTNRRKDGSLYVEEQTITPVPDADGHLTHFIGVKRDLTEQKRLQEQFLQAQKMEVVGRLAGGIAHDFNNLLTVINGRTDLALELLAPNDTIREEFEEIREAGERAARLTKQLLAFSRKHVVQPMPLNVSAAVSGAAQMLRRLIGEDINLSINAPGGPAIDNVIADRGQFEQILLNLAVNARDAMPTGGQLTIDVANVDLDSAFAIAHPGVSAGPHVRLSVTDSGCGMPPDVLSRIFEPFFTTKGHGAGTGLGLATFHSIVTQHHGAVTVESTPGQGTAFHVVLPRVELPAVNKRGHDQPLRGTETILVAEDERSLRELTVKMLRSVGYTAIPAENGPIALAAARSSDAHIDVLLTDVVMPGMSGPELAAALESTHPHVRVLFMSGYTDDTLSLKPSETNRFLPKPFTLSDLTRAIRKLLAGAAEAAGTRRTLTRRAWRAYAGSVHSDDG